MPAAGSRRRWFQFRLRTLLVLVTIAAVLLAILGQKIRQYNREQHVIAWVHAQGGHCWFQNQIDSTEQVSGNATWELWSHASTYTVYPGQYDLKSTHSMQREPMSWWRWKEGPITGASITHSDLKDISPLNELPKLDELILTSTQVSDLSPLVGAKQLRILNLTLTQVSDLSPLVGLKNLEVVILYDAPVTDEQVETLKKALPTCMIIGPERWRQEDGE